MTPRWIGRIRPGFLTGALTGLAVASLTLGFAQFSAASADTGSQATNATAAPVASLVPITNTSFQVTPTSATIDATVGWSATGIAQGLTVGELRVLAINATTKLPTLVARKHVSPLKPGPPVKYSFTVTDQKLIKAMAVGNRVVITATQHPYIFPGTPTQTSYVTVHELQKGPSRGPVGQLDCSSRPISAPPNGQTADYSNCDFTGARLSSAQIGFSGGGRALLEQCDLTGVLLDQAILFNVSMAGSWLAGTKLTGSQFQESSAAGSFAPKLMDPNSHLIGDNFAGATLQDANFSGSTLDGTTFVDARMQGALFPKATLAGDEFNFANLSGANLQGLVQNPGANEWFMVNFSSANLLNAQFPALSNTQFWRKVILCKTVLPDGTVNNRDC